MGLFPRIAIILNQRMTIPKRIRNQREEGKVRKRSRPNQVSFIGSSLLHGEMEVKRENLVNTPKMRTKLIMMCKKI
jgi:hypothetical protein